MVAGFLAQLLVIHLGYFRVACLVFLSCQGCQSAKNVGDKPSGTATLYIPHHRPWIAGVSLLQTEDSIDVQ